MPCFAQWAYEGKALTLAPKTWPESARKLHRLVVSSARAVERWEDAQRIA
jgi:hypothetical protein